MEWLDNQKDLRPYHQQLDRRLFHKDAKLPQNFSPNPYTHHIKRIHPHLYQEFRNYFQEVTISGQTNHKSQKYLLKLAYLI